MIVETIVTTMAPDGALNVAPMGVEWEDDAVVLKPFVETTTFRNLEATRVAVVNLTDDVSIFVDGALGRGTAATGPATVPATMVRGAVLEAACAWREVEVVERDATPPRSRFVARVVHRGTRRDFIGFNRARHAVLEATILATRLHLLPHAEIAAELLRLRPLVEKTGGPDERAAWGSVVDFCAAAGVAAGGARL